MKEETSKTRQKKVPSVNIDSAVYRKHQTHVQLHVHVEVVKHISMVSVYDTKDFIFVLFI